MVSETSMVETARPVVTERQRDDPIPQRLSLRSGLLIESPLDRLLEFAQLDGTYQGYDQISPDPFELNDLDLRLATSE